MESVRQSKVARLVQKELAEYFRKEARNLYDGAFISVTIVRISLDLSVARVYLSIMPGKDPKVILETVKASSFGIRKYLAAVIGKQVRVVPELSFFIDDSLDYAQKIDDLLKK